MRLRTEVEMAKFYRICMNADYRRLVMDYNGDKCIYLAGVKPSGEGKDKLSLVA